MAPRRHRALSTLAFRTIGCLPGIAGIGFMGSGYRPEASAAVAAPAAKMVKLRIRDDFMVTPCHFSFLFVSCAGAKRRVLDDIRMDRRKLFERVRSGRLHAQVETFHRFRREVPPRPAHRAPSRVRPACICRCRADHAVRAASCKASASRPDLHQDLRAISLRAHAPRKNPAALPSARNRAMTASMPASASSFRPARASARASHLLAYGHILSSG